MSKKVPSLLLSPFRRLLRRIAPLHPGLYFLFAFSVSFGGITAGYLGTLTCLNS